jgi:dTDP-4-dehydrorhamnose reductase
LVFRTSWVYASRGKNFLLTVRRLAAERDQLTIVADQIGVPNWSRTLADATARITADGVGSLGERAGLYHMGSTGEASWFELAQAIVGDVERPRVLPIATSDYPTPARRPLYGVLDRSRFQRVFGFALPPWRAELARCLRELEPA